MAEKLITSYQQRGSVSDNCNFLVDDTLQSYRVTGTQIKDYILPDAGLGTSKIEDGAVTLEKLAAAVQNLLVPSGAVSAFAGATVPAGWLLCDGSTVSRATYAKLFTAIGTAHGSGDGVTTFALPDLRGQFIRGRTSNMTANGSGAITGNNATFTAHPFNRTGTKVRVTAGSITGLAAGTDYYLIIIDANTLAFATTLANAIAGTKIAISGTNTGVLTQRLDPDASTRTAAAPGANTGDAVGSFQDDETRAHRHYVVSSQGGNTAQVTGSGFVQVVSGSMVANRDYHLVNGTVEPTLGLSSLAGGSETRVSNISMNFIIKV